MRSHRIITGNVGVLCISLDSTPVWALAAVAYLLPAAIVAVTVGLDTGNYGGRGGVCYLRGDAIWTFVGPSISNYLTWAVRPMVCMVLNILAQCRTIVWC